MAGGDLRDGAAICVVGFRALKDFHPALLADVARARGRACGPRGRARPRPRGPRRRQRPRLRPRLRRPGVPGQVAAQVAARGLRSRRARRVPGRARDRRSARRLVRARARLGRRVFEIPTLPPSVPGMRLFTILREALRRAGGRVLLNNVVIGAERDGGARDARCAPGSACARSAAAPTGSCSRRAASRPAGSSSTRTGRARETALGLPVTGVPARARSASARLLRRPPDRARRHRGRRELRPVDAGGERLLENVLVAGATLAGAEPWQEKSGDGLSLATGYRAAELVLAATTTPARRRRPRGADAMAMHDDDDVLGGSDARVARPLRQVHDLRDVLPGLERHAAVPGAEVRRPAGRALPRRRRAVARRLARLLLGLRDLHAGLPAGRPHRRDQHAGAGGAQAPRTAFKLRDRILARPTLAGRLGTPAAPIANWTLRNRLLRLAARTSIGIHREAPMPKFAGRTFQRWARKHTPPPAPSAGGVLPRLRHELLRAAPGRDDGRAARAQRHRGRRAQAGLLRPAAAVQRPVRRRARLRAPARGAARAVRARRASTSSAPRRAAR